MKKDLFNQELEKYPVKNSKGYVIIPSLPDNLKPLLEIAYNLWWVSNSDALELFRRVDFDLWEEVNHNPIQLLGAIKEERLNELSKDNSFVSHLDHIKHDMKRYMEFTTWYEKEFPDNKNCKIAYFSTEFGLHDSLPLYSGGLGILSGDHIKSASDMGLPLVGVGLLYRYGYFKQYLSYDGWQQEEYVENHFFRMPLMLEKDQQGNPLKIFVEIPTGKIYAQIWRLQIGRIPLYLIDTDVQENKLEDREITGQLYGGDREMRIKQELMLGVGGMRALKALGIEPSVIHINEGHSAFLLLEKIRSLMADQKITFEQAAEVVRISCVFTTHTPVPAGNETFDPVLVDKYLSPLYKKLGLKKEEFLALGRQNPANLNELFCMTILALKMVDSANGVSRLHGTISRNMWTGIWPELPKSEVPITHITNGIHTTTWISREMAQLFDRYLGPTWKDEPEDQSIWERIMQIPDAELWRSHERRRERLVTFARKRLKSQLQNRGASPSEIDLAEEVLDPEALTICFGRRFASYKRGNLIFRDINRLKSMVTKKNMPVQFIFGGKAHPNDNVGKELIKSIIHIARDPDLRDRIVFLENYDMSVSHYMVQGADIWLNNPRRPYEASGTSGMKAAANGTLNFSVLDGWWCEAYNPDNGWAIGSGEEYENTDYQDELESKAMYDILEKDIIPLFYSRGPDGLPRGWTSKMKLSMSSICPGFNTNRMIEEYTRKFYNPSNSRFWKLAANGFEPAKRKAEWKKKACDNWQQMNILKVEDNLNSELILGKTFNIRAKVQLGDVLVPEDVSVQVYFGYLDSRNRMSDTIINEMKLAEKSQDGTYVYEAVIKGDRIGHCGYVVRILPKYEGQVLYIPKLITWQ
ncbi:MAG: alpha-glucan family phosphorylase [Elusimicrobia bacterium]|nr:alpha-glucan family phosphorylase [Candidatus Liberimonas magnetica]